MASAPTYQEILLEEFEYRKSRNSGYSLRAFARDLDMAPSSLNEVLGGSKGISPARARKLVRRLGLGRDLGDVFVLSARAQHARAAVERSAAAKRLAELDALELPKPPKTTTIVSWVTEAVLKLSERTRTELDAAVLARQLDVPEFSTRFAIRFLTRLGFLEGVAPSRAFLAYLGEGRRLNVDYSQILKRATAALREPGDADTFGHEPVLLDAQGVKKARRLLERCLEDIQRLETDSTRSNLFYSATQLFQVETPPRTDR